MQENSSTRYNVFIYKYKFRHFPFLAPLLQQENSRQISIILCVIFHTVLFDEKLDVRTSVSDRRLLMHAKGEVCTRGGAQVFP